MPASRANKTYQNNAFKLFGFNEPILIVIKILKGLTKSFALKTLHELRKFIVYNIVI